MMYSKLIGEFKIERFFLNPEISLNGKGSSARHEILHNIDPTKHDKNTNDNRKWKSDWNVQVQAAIRWHEWKLITGDPGMI